MRRRLCGAKKRVNAGEARLQVTDEIDDRGFRGLTRIFRTRQSALIREIRDKFLRR